MGQVQIFPTQSVRSGDDVYSRHKKFGSSVVHNMVLVARRFQEIGSVWGLKIVKSCSYEDTSNSLVYTVLLQGVSFSHNRQRYRQTDRQTDDRQTDRQTTVAQQYDRLKNKQHKTQKPVASKSIGLFKNGVTMGERRRQVMNGGGQTFKSGRLICTQLQTKHAYDC